MPYTNKYTRGVIDPSNITFDIPVVYYQSLYNIWKQIINEDLYWNLRDQELPWTLLSTGDFLIMDSSSIKIIIDKIDEFYEIPPDPECFGGSLLVTVAASITRILSATLSCSLFTSIQTECAGKTTLQSFLGSVLGELSDSISTDLETEIL